MGFVVVCAVVKMVVLDCEGTLALVVVIVMVMVNGLGLMEWLEGDLLAWGFQLLVASRQGVDFFRVHGVGDLCI